MSKKAISTGAEPSHNLSSLRKTDRKVQRTRHVPQAPKQPYDPNILLSKTKLLRDEAAFLLSVTPRTIDRYLATDKLRCILTPGGHRRVLTESVKLFL